MGIRECVLIVYGSECEQSIEEGAVAPERLAEVFGGDVVALSPLLFQSRAFGGELLGDALDHIGYETVGLFYGLPGLIDKRGLNLVPAMEEIIRSRSFRGGWRCAAWFGRSSPAS
jgi:hypothetical protein